MATPVNRSFRSRSAAWFVEHRVDWLIVLTLVLVAAIPRFVLLTDIPPGLHGDEAGNGLQARRILEDGYIGPMTPFGESGLVYWTAGLFALFGETVFTLRAAFALVGVLTVPLSYLAFRVMFNRTVGVLGALLLAFSAWHIHSSRIAQVPIGWPLAEVAVLLALFLALRHERRPLFAVAGAVLGAGIYLYGAFVTFAIAVGGLLVWLGITRYRSRLKEYLPWIGVLVGVALLVGLPMTSFALHDPDTYTVRYRSSYAGADAEYGVADNLLESGRNVAQAEFDYLQRLISEPVTDTTDGAGAIPFLNGVMVLLLVPGLAICLWRWRNPSHMFLLGATLLMALGPALTASGPRALIGVYHRSLGLTPVLAAIAALPLAGLWDTSRKWGVWALPPAVAVVLAVSSVAAIDLTRYFTTYDDDNVVNFVFTPELAEASSFITLLPDGTYVYFYAGRWGYEYQTRQFIAPDFEGEDRSREFAPSKTVTLGADRTRDVVFVFLDPYLALVEDVQRLYPRGIRHDGLRQNGQPAFSAYYLPALAPGATPHAGETPVPTPTREVLPGGEDRDRMRLADMERIRQALVAYQQKYQEFPTNGGAIQPFCSSETRDAGCRLSEFLDPLPRNLSADHFRGYFYASNGGVYTIYAYRESDVVPQCEERPEELADLLDLMCVKGP